MSGVQLPGPVCAFLDALEIDAGTMCRNTSPAPGPHGTSAKVAPKAAKKDIAIDDAKAIVAEAASWLGTPYALVGEQSVKGTGGDCSGSTQKIYNKAGCSYSYRRAADFAEYARHSGLFRELAVGEPQGFVGSSELDALP